MNEVKDDNRPENLALGDNAININEAIANGRLTHNHNRGENNVRAVLTVGLVQQIRDLRATGISVMEVSRRLGTSYRSTWCVVNGKTWREVP
jgi:hypothetical protein